MLQPTSETTTASNASRRAPTVSVVVPARNEAATIGEVVAGIVALSPPVDEVVVVDDGSTDDTARTARNAGARIVTAGDVLVEHATGPGKGQAMWKGLAATAGDIVVFCDADLVDFDPVYVHRLVDALIAHPKAVMVKGRYRRGGTGGRVNELVARPALELLHPSLSSLAQPLGGEYAAWRAALVSVPFVHGYGVDLGLVLDLSAAFGDGAVIETELSIRSHRNRSLDELRPQARLVLEVALQRAGRSDAPIPQCPPLREVTARDRRSA